MPSTGPPLTFGAGQSGTTAAFPLQFMGQCGVDRRALMASGLGAAGSADAQALAVATAPVHEGHLLLAKAAFGTAERRKRL